MADDLSIDLDRPVGPSLPTPDWSTATVSGSRSSAPRSGPVDALDTLEGYRNDDGGYGWGLEPDLRAPESQPAGV